MTQQKKDKYEPRLKVSYKEKIAPAMSKEFNIKSPMGLPRLAKLVVSMGVNEAKDNIAVLERCKEDLTLICGQAAQIRRAKKSISNFKLREGMPIGLKVTLRGNRMYEFIDRFISIACPRIRDFQGFNVKGFDGNGNLNIGLKEHHIFPEINTEKSPKAYGLNITFVTTSDDDKISRKFLEYIGVPFVKAKKKS
ncbi:MAG TPA: 50S ribosomal protein L5 [Elusimicrobiales bacterium]|nr:50S ribosomal protein L5 [Elusimicrobiales bacterium]